MDFAPGPTLATWRRERGAPSLAEVHRSDRRRRGAARRGASSRASSARAISSPSATWTPATGRPRSPAARSFGYTLLFVALVSNIMAIILQSLCARLAVATGRDLAQACRDAYPAPVAWPLWVLAELAICATDLAEVIGTAIGLNLLFGIPLEIGVVITALDVFLILYLQNKGFRWIEAFIITLLGVIAVCFLGADRPGRSATGARSSRGFVADDARSSPIRTCSTSRSASSARR